MADELLDTTGVPEKELQAAAKSIKARRALAKRLGVFRTLAHQLPQRRMQRAKALTV